MAAALPGGSVASTDPTTALAAIGETPAQFEQSSGGVTLAELQTQLSDLQAGTTPPAYAVVPSAGTPTTIVGAPGTPGQPTLAGSAGATPDTVYTCQAFGSNEYTSVINTGGLIGFAHLGFSQGCTNPPGTMSSSCNITGKVGSNSKTASDNNGGVSCSADVVVGKYHKGRAGTMSATWGGHNEVGVPFIGLSGCVADGTSAFCSYKTGFTVGHNNTWGWGAGG